MTPKEYCQDKAAKSGSSFYYSFMFLPKAKREAITALYASAEKWMTWSMSAKKFQ